MLFYFYILSREIFNRLSATFRLRFLAIGVEEYLCNRLKVGLLINSNNVLI